MDNNLQKNKEKRKVIKNYKIYEFTKLQKLQNVHNLRNLQNVHNLWNLQMSEIYEMCKIYEIYEIHTSAAPWHPSWYRLGSAWSPGSELKARTTSHIFERVQKILNKKYQRLNKKKHFLKNMIFWD